LPSYVRDSLVQNLIASVGKWRKKGGWG